ncbi:MULTISPECIES: tyrosine-type recombinase/integrase [unclassified Bradyrhizobium]|uniref:tyrosine-type recombinase/integrase n=1 Tax=unclassified Bradyrhizobium TaxID=2631580 RepID=UPI0028E9B48F|nr:MULTISPECIES: tyrosine-type recombinase/integrase [unclassified Bradyrhizobium]
MTNATTVAREAKADAVTLHCETKVEKRDRKADFGRHAVPGLMIDRTPAGTLFYFRFINPVTRKRDQVSLGTYHADAFTVGDARLAALRLRNRVKAGDNVSQILRDEEAARAEEARVGGVTMNRMIDQWIAEIKRPVKREHVGMVPKIKTWANLESQLRRFVKPTLGRKLVREVTAKDIATLEDDIKAGAFGKPSVSNARHVRKALSSLFTWGAYPRQGYVTANPCATLEPLEKEPGRDRTMTPDEIRAFWHLLGSDQLGALSLHVRLLFKFALATGRRTDEVRALHVNEIVDLDGENPHMVISAKRVKNGKPIVMALSTLAVEIIKAALTDDGQQFVFKSPIHAEKPVHRKAMNAALRGNDRGRKSLWDLMGFKRNADGKFDDDVFKPHDFRHTAATLLVERGFMDSDISIALGHTFKGERTPGVRTAGPRAPAVTLGYIHSHRLPQKRRIMEAWADELRRIINAKPEEAEQRLAA